MVVFCGSRGSLAARLKERWPLLMVAVGVVLVFSTSQWPRSSAVLSTEEGHQRRLLLAENISSQVIWSDVCATEIRRIRISRRGGGGRRLIENRTVAPPLVMRLRGGDSRSSIPLSMIEGSKVYLDVAPGLYGGVFLYPLTTTTAGGDSDSIQQKEEAQEKKIGCSRKIQTSSMTVKADYSHCGHHKHRRLGKKHHHRASGCYGAPQRIGVIGIACNEYNEEIGRMKTSTSIIPRSTNARRHCGKGWARPPEPSNAQPLLSILDGSRDPTLLRKAAQKLEKYMNERAILCTASHKCKVHILDKKCPSRLLCHGHEASLNPSDDINIGQRIRDAPPCLFASAISSANLLRYEEIEDYCVEICIPRTLVQRAAHSYSPKTTSSALPKWFQALELFGDKQIFYDAAAGLNTTKTPRDDDYVCYVAHMHALAIWWAEHTSGNPTGDADPPKGGTEGDGVLAKVTPNTKLSQSEKIKAKELETCAVVASGHSLRCSSKSWGPLIDNGYYDAVFKINKLQFANESIYNALECDFGRRADYIVNFFPETTIVPHVGIHLQHTLNLVRSLGSVLVQKSPARYKAALSVFDAIHLDVAMPTEDSRDRAIGKSSGTAALTLALSMCRHVDAFGFGVFRSDAAHRSSLSSTATTSTESAPNNIIPGEQRRQSSPLDFRYLHLFHPAPTPETPNLAHDLLASELRNALFHAYGIANMVWW